MVVTRLADGTVFETSNAIMHTLTSPSRQGSALAVWRVSMEPGASGPEHRMDADQVCVVLTGILTVTVDGDREALHPGDAVLIPNGTLRQIGNAGQDTATAIVSMPGGARVSTPSGSHSGELPWAS